MKIQKLLALGLALVLMLCLFAGCKKDDAETSAPPASSEPSAAPENSSAPEESTIPLGETLKIGHICDLTGNEQTTGEEAKRSLEFAVNDLGGVFANHPIEIITVDAKGTTDGAVDAAKKLVEKDGVIAIFGPTQAGQKSAVAEYMKLAEVPLVFYNGSPDMLLNGNDWLVGVGGANAQMPSVMADYVYKELKYRTVDTIAIDNIGFRGFVDVFKASFENLGGTVKTQAYAPFGSDWSSYLVGLDKGVDGIMAWCTGGDAINLWKTWYEMGLNKTLPMTGILQSAFTDYYILDAINNANPDNANAMLGAVSPTVYVYNIDTPENKAFVDAWVKEFGGVPATNLPGQIYQTIILLKAALEKTDGASDPDTLIKALFSTEITGPCGRLFFDNSNAANKDIYVCEVVKLDDGSFNSSVLATYKNVPPTGLGA